MILEMYSVFDGAVNAYTTPMFFRSRGEALRSFTEASNDEKSNISKYAKDYHLMSVGEFDDGTGVVLGHLPVRVVSAIECIIADPVFPPEKEIRGNGSGVTHR